MKERAVSDTFQDQIYLGALVKELVDTKLPVTNVTTMLDE